MRFLEYNDKTDLKAFCKSNSPVELRGAKVLIFEDFSADVAKRRCAHSSICSYLHMQKFSFHILYPATLMVLLDGGPTKSFTTAADAEKVLHTILNMAGEDLSRTKDKSQPKHSERRHNT